MEEHFEGAEILLNRTGVVTVLIKGRLHKFVTNKPKEQDNEDEQKKEVSPNKYVPMNMKRELKRIFQQREDEI